MGCQNFQVTGFQEDGGYAQYMIARSEAVAAIPDALSPMEAAPILCAGVTTFNSLRHSGQRGAIWWRCRDWEDLGIWASSSPTRWAITPWRSGGAKTRKHWLGAARYLDTDTTNAASELTQMGGALVILATAPNSKAMSELIDGLAVGGKLLVVGHQPTPLPSRPFNSSALADRFKAGHPEPPGIRKTR
jgi:D-arabinose 1-dehydrogenase-like Zn-dependent alcohol dehydrogenase